MKQCNVIGIDLAKNIFQACIINKEGKILLNKAMKRNRLKQWLTNQEISIVAMESCGGSNDWGRFAKSLGHHVMIIPPKQVKPYRNGQKTDANDAIAIAVASRAANIRPARMLNIEQQNLQSIERMRDIINKQKLQISNQLRGLLLEFGIVINKTVVAFKAAIPLVLEDAENPLSAVMRESVYRLWQLYLRLEEDFDALDKSLKQLAENDEECQRLMKLEGVGPISAVRLKVQLGHGEHFRSGRQAAACIGATPKQHSSGGRVVLGTVGKASCDRPLRSCLFLGARSAVSQLKRREPKNEKEVWLKALIERRGINCSAMALVNKTIRTAYAMLKTGGEYRVNQLAA